MSTVPGWHFWIDRGGTFTDIVARSPAGRGYTHKLLSENPLHYDDAPAAGIGELLARHGRGEEPIAEIRLGTTVATNALLERRGVPTALVITAGFGDALRIGYQNRPELFARQIVLPEMLYTEVVEARERIDAAGTVLQPLDVAALERSLRELRGRGIESIAIVFMHGHAHCGHERTAALLARRLGFEEVCASHEVSPLIRLVSRGDTTVVDAYLTPLLQRYVRRFRARLGPRHADARLLFMQSSGGLATAEAVRGAQSLLSGPAGGLVGMARAGEALRRRRLIGFDMGGTSTDVALYDGRYPRRFDSTIAGIRLQAPMMNIHTVAAGGGSLLSFEGGRLRVGPQSAGADPGPACYRRGGPLAVTDIHVLLGRLQPARFPRVFGPDGRQPLDLEAVQARFTELAGRVTAATGRPTTPERLAEGFLEVAVETMAHAIRHVSVRLGHDATEYALFCFGGAAGQHACRVADALGIAEVLIHPLAGILSAWGIGQADLRVLRRQSVEQPLSTALAADLATLADELAASARASLVAQGADQAGLHDRREAEIKAVGTDTALPVVLGPEDAMRQAFTRAFRQRFGFEPGPAGLLVSALRVEAVSPGAASGTFASPPPQQRADGSAQAYFGGWRQVPVLERSALEPGRLVDGPAILVEDNATTVVEPGWQAGLLEGGELRLVRTTAIPRREIAPAAPDPVLLELFGHRFMQVAEQMGAVLESTARVGKHPRAARLLLRRLRRRRRADRQRAAHAGASGFDGRERATGHRRPCRQHAARRCVDAERALRRRYASARRDGGKPGVHRGR